MASLEEVTSLQRKKGLWNGRFHACQRDCIVQRHTRHSNHSATNDTAQSRLAPQARLALGKTWASHGVVGQLVKKPCTPSGPSILRPTGKRHSSPTLAAASSRAKRLAGATYNSSSSVDRTSVKTCSMTRSFLKQQSSVDSALFSLSMRGVHVQQRTEFRCV